MMADAPPHTIEQHCLMRGCRGIACFGFGSIRKGNLKWACRDHRGLIEPMPERREAPPPPQGRLFG